MVGLQGSGKTTTTAKLARFFQKKGLKAAVICADTYRPGAYDQLSQLCERIGVAFYGESESSDAVEITTRGLAELKRYDVILVDTAAATHSKRTWFSRWRQSTKRRKRTNAFWCSTPASSASERTSESVQRSNRLTGVIVTKLDGTAKGGGALSAVAEVGTGIAFIGMGETIDDLEKFEPDRSSLDCSHGDMKTLVEMIEEEPPSRWKKQRRCSKASLRSKTCTNKWMRYARWPLTKIVQMLPLDHSASTSQRGASINERNLERFKVVMDSMTDESSASTDNSKFTNKADRARFRITSDYVRELLKYHKRCSGR